MMSPRDYTKYVYQNWGRSRTSKGMEAYSKNDGLAIMSLGLAGEAGETLEHVKKHIRDGKEVGNEFLLEAGDTLHYLTRLLAEFGYTLQDAIDANVVKLDKRFGHRVDNANG